VNVDKQVRRRRAVLGLLVAVSLILLTVYFGESPSSPLHTIQRGIVEVLSPVQTGASKALKPVRDIAGWFSDTFHAKSERDQLRKEVQSLTAQLGVAQSAVALNRQLSKEVHLQDTLGLDTYGAVAASVIGRDPTLWYATIEVDKGADDGGLVGKVSTVGPTFSIVTEITDHSMAVAAQVQDSSADTGILVPAVGNPNQLLLQNLPSNAPIQAGQQVVTAGFKYNQLESLYPPGIPIGVVSNASQDMLLNNQQVQVNPAVDLRHLNVVQILTSPHAGTRRASLP
jgi:rod shape-determining protein MreC